MNDKEIKMNMRTFELMYPDYGAVRQGNTHIFDICDHCGNRLLVINIKERTICFKGHTELNTIPIEMYDDIRLFFNFYRAEYEFLYGKK